MARRWLPGVGAGVLALGLGLQVLNTIKVREALCAYASGDAGCTASMGLTSVAFEWRPPATLVALADGTLRPFARTALIRKTCDDAWTVGVGARIELAGAAFATPTAALSTSRACVDTDGKRLTGVITGAALTTGGCSVQFAPVRIGSDGAVQAAVTATLDPGTAPQCAELLPAPARSFAAATLVQARLALTARYERPSGPPTSGAAGEGSMALGTAGGFPRRLLSSMKTTHDVEITVPGAHAVVHVETAPGSESAALSPEIRLSVRADGPLAEPLAEPLRSLDVRWHLDHERGQVVVNGQTVERVPMAAMRPAGRTVLATDECDAAAGRGRALYFVETGDRGELLRPEQLDRALAAVDGAVTGAGALVSVFVHGWQHSASARDSYACRFADVIASAEEMESYAARTAGRPPRQVIGIYVGWPGAVYPNELANTVTTFWNRLDVADRLGTSDASVRPLLEGLSQRIARRSSEPRADRRSVLVVAGHSMGARAVFHALRDDLLGARNTQRDVHHPDLVLLLNPAFSATLYRALHERQKTCAATDVPVLLFSSESDGVTRQVYPAGQAVTYPYGTADSAPFLEHIYTAPNFAEFVTHRLRLELVSGTAPGPDDAQTILRGFERIPANSRELYNDNPVTVYRQPRSGRPGPGDVWYRLQLVGVPGAPPCDTGTVTSKVIEVDSRIVPDHGRIFTPPFMEYIVRLLNRQARGDAGLR